MTLTENKRIKWTAGTVLAFILIVWGGGAWVERVDARDSQQNDNISLANAKATQALEISVEYRTRIIIAEQRIERDDARITELEKMHSMVESIYNAVVRDAR